MGRAETKVYKGCLVPVCQGESLRTRPMENLVAKWDLLLIPDASGRARRRCWRVHRLKETFFLSFLCNTEDCHVLENWSVA